MRTQIASRLTRLEQNTGTGSRRIVVVEKNSLEAARAFLQGRDDVDMDRKIEEEMIASYSPRCNVSRKCRVFAEGPIKHLVGVRLYRGMRLALEKLAEADDRSISYVINKIVAEYLRARKLIK